MLRGWFACASITLKFALKLKVLGKMRSRFDGVDPDHVVEKYEKKDADALRHNNRFRHSGRMETNPGGKQFKKDFFCRT